LTRDRTRTPPDEHRHDRQQTQVFHVAGFYYQVLRSRMAPDETR